MVEAVDVVLPEVFAVFFPKIHLVRLDFPRKASEALPVELCLEDEVGGLVVGIPAEMVHIGVSVHDAGPNLRAELDLGPGLPPDDGSQVGLVDADDAVSAGAHTLLEHHLLLLIHPEGGLKTPVVMAAEACQQVAGMSAEEVKEYLHVGLKAAYLDQLGLVNELLALTLLLGVPDKCLAGFHAVGLWLLDMVSVAVLVKQAVYQMAPVLKKVCVGRIAHLCIAAGGIDLQRASVHIAVLIGVLALWHAAVCLGQHQRQHVEELLVKTLADQNKQLGDEHGMLRKAGKPQKVLHVGVLLDGLDGLLIAQVLHVLHYQRADHHTGWLVAGTTVFIAQALVVFLLYLVPWKAVGEFHPAVCLAKTRERML